MVPFETPDTPDIAGVINSVGQVYNLLYVIMFLGVTVLGCVVVYLSVKLIKGIIDEAII